MPLNLVYLSLGSNVRDRLANLRAAIALLPLSGVNVKKSSSIYETEPVDFLDQPWFLNCVVEAETKLDPLALLQALRAMEAQLDGKKEFPKGPRKIDLDILLFNSETIDTLSLKIPHPRMHLRRFVLVPLAEIAPHVRHPNWPGTAANLLASTPDQSQVRPIAPAR
jgi:2-amino-4-hydroxy-6-hydroxymethyldihydropteridine diphosphokinase